MHTPSIPKALRSLSLALVIFTTTFTAASHAEDRECPTVIHADYALFNKALPVRLMANAAVYGFIYAKYGVEYVRSLVGQTPPPPRTDLYARPIYVETRSFCAGDDVLVNGVPARVVDAVGPAFTSDPDVRAIFALPRDASNLLNEDGTRVEVAVANAHEIASVDRVAVATDVLDLLPISGDRDEGQVKPGDQVSDCEGKIGAFRRVFARPGQLVREPGEQIVEFGTPATLLPLKDLCIRLAPPRYVDVGVRGVKNPDHARGRVTGYRGYGSVTVLFDDGLTEVISRARLTKP